MTWCCPSPRCEREFAECAELTRHINSEHSGEYQEEGWPDP